MPPPPPTEKKMANRVVEISEVDSDGIAKEVERRRQEKRRKARERGDPEKKGEGTKGFTYSEGSSETNLKNARRQDEESSQRKSLYGVSEACPGASLATIICLFATMAQLLLR